MRHVVNYTSVSYSVLKLLLDPKDDYTTQVVKTSVTNNSLSKDYLHPDDHDKEITTLIILI